MNDQPEKPELSNAAFIVENRAKLAPAQGAAGNQVSANTGEPAAPTFNPPSYQELLARAIDRGQVELADKLMDLAERAEARVARREYDQAFASAKSEVGIVLKTAKGNFGAYASLADIARALDTVLGKYGLSYRFRSATTDRQLILTCIISHRAGHSEENSLPGPLEVSGSRINAYQQVGSASTYLMRYCLIQAWGLASEAAPSEIHDDDGRNLDPDKVRPIAGPTEQQVRAFNAQQREPMFKQDRHEAASQAHHDDEERLWQQREDRLAGFIDDLPSFVACDEWLAVNQRFIDMLPIERKARIVKRFDQRMVRLANAGRSS
jgi:hypothetical protein